jgi:hypothetical protein
MTPTARTLAYLRAAGFQCAVVERWLPHANVRSDLWHFADVIACHPAEKVILLVQTTTAGHLAHRLAKAKSRPELQDWLAAGGRFVLHGWRWAVKVIKVRGEDLEVVTLAAPPRRKRQRKQLLMFE